MQPFPKIIAQTLDSVRDAVLQIGRFRDEDIRDRNNFPQVFVQGRSVGRVPSGSADVVPTDRIGDQNLTADYAYFCVNDGMGAAVWRRIAMGSW